MLARHGLVCSFLLAGAPAHAQDAPPPPPSVSETPAPDAIPDPLDQWTFQIEPRVWYVAPGGKLRLPGTAAAGGGDRIRLEEMNMDSPRVSPAAELNLRRGDWRLDFSGFAFGMGDRGFTAEKDGQIGSVVFATGDTLTSELDFASWELGAAYRLDVELGGEHRGGGHTLLSGLEALGGLRFYDVSTSVSLGGGSASADEFFAEPFLGGRLTLELIQQFTIEVRADIGAFSDGRKDSFSVDIAAAFAWHPTPNLGVQVGYRQLAFDLHDGDSPETFEFRGAMAGLFGGLVVKF